MSKLTVKRWRVKNSRLGFLFDRIKDRVSRWANDESRVNDSDLIFSLSSSHITLDRNIFVKWSRKSRGS
jgi:hypothetical protein